MCIRDSSYSVDIWQSLTAKLAEHSQMVQGQVLEMFQGVQPDQIPDVMGQCIEKVVEASKVFSQQNVDIMTKLWDEYDANGDGFLSIEELSKMQRHSMQKAADDLQANIEVAIDGYLQGVKVGFENAGLFDQEADNPDQYESKGAQMLAEVHAQRGLMIEQATEGAKTKMDELLDPVEQERRCRDLWTAMDLNSDGVVTKTEYLDMYLAHQTKLQMEETFTAMGLEWHMPEHVSDT
eukprot:TRINITY_DN5499_c0_g2_i5.p1 TRINITY_DN5499_c0_g2~~TRINITY_DN5499_c0_g2_i5.p1  ORF type:complete len:236 (+),score=81.62 TRINITY_DN5499_c0_g2_i5:199-906(+)